MNRKEVIEKIKREIPKKVYDISAETLHSFYTNEETRISISSWNPIGTEGATAIGEVLKNNKTLINLEWYHSQIGANGGKAIGESLKINRTLKHLCIHKGNIGTEGAKRIAVALKTNNVLTSLTLYEDNIGAEGAKAFAEALRTNSVLTHLYLAKNNIGAEGAKVILRGLDFNKALKSLNLSCNNLNDQTGKIFGQMLKVNNTLTYVDLSENKIKAGGARIIGEALKSNNTLESLDLAENNIGAEGANAIGEALKLNNKLASLHLDKNNIGGEGAKAIERGLKLNKSLKKLKLSANNLGVKGLQAVGEMLKTNNTLTEINLSETNAGTEGWEAMGIALKINKTLTYLDLSKSNLRDLGAKTIGTALKINKALTYLRLSENNLRENGAKAIGEALKVNKTLYQLDLSENNLREGGAEAVGEALKVNRTLRFLDLSKNNLREGGAKAIGEALKINKTLYGLTIYDNNLGYNGGKAILESLKVNRSLRNLIIHSNKIGEQVQNEINKLLGKTTEASFFKMFFSNKKNMPNKSTPSEAPKKCEKKKDYSPLFTFNNRSYYLEEPTLGDGACGIHALLGKLYQKQWVFKGLGGGIAEEIQRRAKTAFISKLKAEKEKYRAQTLCCLREFFERRSDYKRECEKWNRGVADKIKNLEKFYYRVMLEAKEDSPLMVLIRDGAAGENGFKETKKSRRWERLTNKELIKELRENKRDCFNALEAIREKLSSFLSPLKTKNLETLTKERVAKNKEASRLEEDFLLSSTSFGKYFAEIAQPSYFLTDKEMELAAYLFEKRLLLFSSNDMAPILYGPHSGDEIAILNEGIHYSRLTLLTKEHPVNEVDDSLLKKSFTEKISALEKINHPLEREIKQLKQEVSISSMSNSQKEGFYKRLNRLSSSSVGSSRSTLQ
ncbi:hypothetical protein [Candidatus Neptunochlamydia vexilliferae]|uniref:hypothetical protein n=1 Tax=Candidatus Neptunichlamydia vexilliferae TaxID=1651774 RepID=UPI001E4B463F|nr:hypothetical protein [Candidatus Neptunochlamydia vexilliferae]